MQAVSKVILLTNQLATSVEAVLRAGSSDRYTLHPQQVRLKPGQTTEVEVKLKVVRFAQIEKAVEHGQRDTIHIKTPYFDQKFAAVFFLGQQHLPSAPPRPAAGRRPAARAQAMPDRDAAKDASCIMPGRAHADAAGSLHLDAAAGEARRPENPPLFSFRLPESPAALPARDQSVVRQVRHMQAAHAFSEPKDALAACAFVVDPNSPLLERNMLPLRPLGDALMCVAGSGCTRD